LSSVTSTPGTTLRLKVRDEAGVDQDLKLPFDITRLSRFSRVDSTKVKTILMDDFDPPQFPWTMKDVFGAADTSASQQSPFCRVVDSMWWGTVRSRFLQVYGGNVVANAVQADTKMSTVLEDNVVLGAEIVYGFTNEQLEENNQLELVVEKFTGAEEQKGTLRHTPSTFLLEMESPDGIWVTVETNARGPSLEHGMFNYMRLEIDYRPATPVYYEAQFNNIVLKPPTIPTPIGTQVDVTGKKMGLELHLWNNTGTVFGAEYFVKFLHFYKLR